MEELELFDELSNLLNDKKYRAFRDKIVESEVAEVDIAQFIDEKLEGEQVIIAFRTLPKTMASDVFSFLSADTQQAIINAITDKELQNIVDDLYIDDAVDMLDEAPATVVRRVLENASVETRNLINQFLKYSEDSAGSIMTAEYLYIKKDMTVEEALKRIRRTCKDKETSYTCYVLDKDRVLEGVISIKTILMAKDDEYIEDIMDRNIVSVTTDEDKEQVAKLFSKYDLLVS